MKMLSYVYLLYVIQDPSPCYSYIAQKSRKFIICFSKMQ